MIYFPTYQYKLSKHLVHYALVTYLGDISLNTGETLRFQGFSTSKAHLLICNHLLEILLIINSLITRK